MLVKLIKLDNADIGITRVIPPFHVSQICLKASPKIFPEIGCLRQVALYNCNTGLFALHIGSKDSEKMAAKDR